MRLFPFSYIYSFVLFFRLYICDTVKLLSLSDLFICAYYLPSPSMSLKNDRISYFSWQITILLCVYHITFIHSYVDGHLGCFHILAAANIAAVNIGVHVSSQIVLFRRMSRSGIPGSYNNSLFQFF